MAGLVLVSGPSCVGKGPLVSALERHHPELAAQLVPLVLHNSRAPRRGEVNGVDYTDCSSTHIREGTRGATPSVPEAGGRR